MIQEIDNNSHSLCIRRRQGQLPRRCGGLSIGGSKIVCELMYKYTLVMLNVALRIIPLTSFPLHNNFKIEVSISTTSFHRTHLKSFNIKIMPSTFFKSTPPCAFYILLGHKSVLTKFESIACFILIIIVKRHISHLPESDNIVNLLSNTGNARSVASVVKLTLDILLMTTARTVNRACFPIVFFLHTITVEQYASLHGPDTKEVDFLVPMHFSGLDAVKINNDAATANLGYKAKTKEGAEQIIFHGIWRTHIEELGILKFVTGVTFKKRRELQVEFPEKQKMATILVSPIKLLKFAKLSTACQTDLIVPNKQQVHHACIFSGPRILVFNKALTDLMSKKDKQAKNGKLYVSSRNFRGSRGIHGGMNKIDSPRHVPLLDVGMFQFSHYCFYD
uniref:Uncharacterized protein n=2 Tax=Cacopsylla melanoneura TaxID=428564 RepID=A0A8D9ESX8_9HEMI